MRYIFCTVEMSALYPVSAVISLKLTQRNAAHVFSVCGPPGPLCAAFRRVVPVPGGAVEVVVTPGGGAAPVGPLRAGRGAVPVVRGRV